MQSFHPQPGHPGLPHGQPMGMPGAPHAPGQMIPHMQMGMGGPNMAQGGQMMVNMHPGGGMGGPGGSNAHALSHLQPQGAMFRPQMPQGMPPNPMPGQAMLARNRIMMGGQQPQNMMMGMPNGMSPQMMQQYQAMQAQRGMMPGGMQFPQQPGIADIQRSMAARQLQQQQNHQQQQNLMHNIAMQQAASQQSHPGQPHAQQMRPQVSMQGAREGMPQGPHLPQQPQIAQAPNQPQINPGTPQQPQRVAQQGQAPQPQQTPVQAPTPAPNRQATATPQQPQQQNMQAQQQAIQQQNQQQQQQSMQAQQAMLAQQQAPQPTQKQNQAQSQQEQPQQQQPAQQAGPEQSAVSAQVLQNQQQLLQQQAAQQANNLQNQEKLRQSQHMLLQQQKMMAPPTTAIARLIHFTDRMGSFRASQTDKADTLQFWQELVAEFFADDGVFKAQLLEKQDRNRDQTKTFEISAQVLPRFFYEQNMTGVDRMLVAVNSTRENKLPNNGHFLESKASFTFWYNSGSQVVWAGSMRALLSPSPQNKFTLFDFSPEVAHEEYLPRSLIEKLLEPDSPVVTKNSPNVTKGKNKQMKGQMARPNLPESPVGSLGLNGQVQQFLEAAHTMSMMQQLFDYSDRNEHLAPRIALEQLNEQMQNQPAQPQMHINPQMMQASMLQANMQAQNMANMQANMQMQMGQPGALRTPGMNGPQGNMNQFASPANLNLSLPTNRMTNNNSPQMPQMAQQNSSQGTMGPPNNAPAMVAQRSQQGNRSDASTTASPNAANKRRRASTIKNENSMDDSDANGAQPKVKPSPKVGGKRQKGNGS